MITKHPNLWQIFQQLLATPSTVATNAQFVGFYRLTLTFNLDPGYPNLQIQPKGKFDRPLVGPLSDVFPRWLTLPRHLWALFLGLSIGPLVGPRWGLTWTLNPKT